MGAQGSVARSKDEVLQIGEECSKKSGTYRLWTHVNPCTKNKKIKGTIFTKENISSEERAYFDNGVKMLKQLRHPGIVSFLEASSMATSLSLMTERVQILDLCIDSLSSVEIHSGLRQVLEVLIFLHERAGISHNSICPSSIFVTQSGEWKLGSFEMAQSFKTTRNVVQSQFYRKTRMDGFAPPDANPQSGESTGDTWRDSFAFGRLIDYSCRFIDDSAVDDEIVAALRSAAEALSSPASPPSLRSLASTPAFSNHLTTIIDFLESVHLKSDEEKDEFFSQLSDRLHSLPSRVVSRRLCRLAMSRYVLLEPRSHTTLYPLLLSPQSEPSSFSSATTSSTVVPPSSPPTTGLLPLELYRNHVIPEVVRVFRVRDTSVRLSLLAHFDRYSPYIPLNQLEGFVLEEVLFSSQDVDDRLVSASLRAMCSLVSLLGAERVCPWKLTKHFVDGTPKVGTNSPKVASTVRRPAAPPRAILHLEDEEESIGESSASTLDVRGGGGVVGSRSGGIPASRHIYTEDVEEEMGEMETMVEDGKRERGRSGHISEEEQGTVESTWNNDEDWTSDWERKENEETRDAEKESESERQVTDTSVSPARTSSGLIKKVLVPEYEIPAVRSYEDDFFADMQPEIKTGGSIIDRLLEAKRLQEEEREQRKRQLGTQMANVAPPPSTSQFSLSMDASAADEVGTAGWAEDENDDVIFESEEGDDKQTPEVPLQTTNSPLPSPLASIPSSIDFASSDELTVDCDDHSTCPAALV